MGKRLKNIIFVIVSFCIVLIILAGSKSQIASSASGGAPEYSLGNTVSGDNMVPMIYDSFDNYRFENGFAIVNKRDWPHDNYGVIDRDGNVLIPLEYDSIVRAGHGLVASKKTDDVNRDSFWMIKNGKATRVGEYSVINSFFPMEGLTWVVSLDGKSGFIDVYGKVIAPAVYEDSEAFNDGMAGVKKNGKWGYIDTKGALVIPCEFDVVNDSYCSRFIFGYAAVKKEGKTVMIDKKGAVAFPFYIKESELERLDRYGVAFGSEGIVDKKRNVLTKISVTSAEPFSGGYAFFTESTADSKTKYGVVNRSGKITARYLEASPAYETTRLHWGQDLQISKETCKTSFSEGLAAVCLNGKWGYINARGKVVIDFQFETAMDDIGSGYYSDHPGGEPFKNGRAKVYSGGEWKIINKKGIFIMK